MSYSITLGSVNSSESSLLLFCCSSTGLLRFFLCSIYY